MAEKLSLGVQIGAALTSGFNNAIGGAREKFNILGKEIKSLASQRGLIERVEQDRAALDKARLGLTATQKQVGALKLALRADPGNKGLAADLSSAQAKAEKLSLAIDKQKGKLLSSEMAMQKAGVKVGDLGREYTKLGQILDATRQKQAKMEAIMAKKSAAGERLGEMKGQILGVAGAAYGAGKVIGEAMDSQYELRMFGNVANLTDQQLAAIRLQLKGIASDTKQKPGALLEGLNVLTAKGLDPTRAMAAIGIIGKTATASGADIKDLATTAYTLIDAMGLSPEELPHALDMLAKAGKAGSFELKDMAQYFPMLTAQAKALKLGGTEGIASIGAALQIAMKGASDPATAANNFQNFLAKLTAPETVKRFEKFGVNIEQKMKEAMAAGKNPIEEMILLTEKLTGGDKFRIGELFGDMQVINFLNPMLQNMEEYRRIKADTFAASGVVDQDFENIARTGKIQLEAFAISTGRLGDAFATTLLPAVNSALQPLVSMAIWAGDLIERFPMLGKLIGAVAVGVGVFVLGLTAVTAATWLWNAALLANPIGLTVAAIAGAAALIITFWQPITGFFKGIWDGIKEQFSAGVGFLTKIWEMSPLGLLFKAGQKLAGFVGGLLPTPGGVAPGMALATAGGPGLQSPSPIRSSATPARQFPQVQAAGFGAKTTTVHAPVTNTITVHAAPGMDEKKLAAEVDRRLDARDSAAQAKKRGALHD